MSRPVVQKYQDILKTVKNHADFKALMTLINSDEEAPFIVVKRRGYRAFAFDNYRYRIGDEIHVNPEYCDYLIDDGISRGKCRWENLYRYLSVVS